MFCGVMLVFCGVFFNVLLVFCGVCVTVMCCVVLLQSYLH